MKFWAFTCYDISLPCSSMILTRILMVFWHASAYPLHVATCLLLKFLLIFGHAAAYGIHAATCCFRVFDWCCSCRGMKKSCCDIWLSNFWLMLLACRDMKNSCCGMTPVFCTCSFFLLLFLYYSSNDIEIIKNLRFMLYKTIDTKNTS